MNGLVPGGRGYLKYYNRVPEACPLLPAPYYLKYPNFFFFFITRGLELSDANVYEPYIRALLGRSPRQTTTSRGERGLRMSGNIFKSHFLRGGKPLM